MRIHSQGRGDAIEDRCRVIGENRRAQMADQVEQLFGEHIVPVVGLGIDAAMIGEKMRVIAFVGCDLHGVGHRREDRLQPFRQPLRHGHLLRQMPDPDAVGRDKQDRTRRQRLDHRNTFDCRVRRFRNAEQSRDALRKQVGRMMLDDERAGPRGLRCKSLGVGDEFCDDLLDIARRRVDRRVAEQWLEMRRQDRDQTDRQRFEDGAPERLRP